MSTVSQGQHQSPAERLVNLLGTLASEFVRVERNALPDLSQDRIKVVFNKTQFSHFLQGRDDLIVPLTFEIWPSLTCDARCALCTYSLNGARREADRTDQAFIADVQHYRNVLEQFGAAGVRSVIVTGGGEPTLHPQLGEIVRGAVESGLRWGMFTHGLHLQGALLSELLELEPRFLRISINAGSAAAHAREYRLGESAYRRILGNVVQTARLAAGTDSRIGLGYALSGVVSDDELAGILDFVSQVVERSDGTLGFVAFRPKVLYYDRHGVPRTHQPRAEQLETLARRIGELIVEPLRERFGDALRIDHKRGMFERVVDAVPPAGSIATAWTGQIDHRGVGYILSELNGSPWANASYGGFDGANFDDVWFGERRTALSVGYALGDLRPPVHHKIAHIDALLGQVRHEVGFLSAAEVAAFYDRFDALQWPRPRHWDFL